MKLKSPKVLLTGSLHRNNFRLIPILRWYQLIGGLLLNDNDSEHRVQRVAINGVSRQDIDIELQSFAYSQQLLIGALSRTLGSICKSIYRQSSQKSPISRKLRHKHLIESTRMPRVMALTSEVRTSAASTTPLTVQTYIRELSVPVLSQPYRRSLKFRYPWRFSRFLASGHQ